MSVIQSRNLPGFPEIGLRSKIDGSELGLTVQLSLHDRESDEPLLGTIRIISRRPGVPHPVSVHVHAFAQTKVSELQVFAALCTYAASLAASFEAINAEPQLGLLDSGSAALDLPFLCQHLLRRGVPYNAWERTDLYGKLLAADSELALADPQRIVDTSPVRFSEEITVNDEDGRRYRALLELDGVTVGEINGHNGQNGRRMPSYQATLGGLVFLETITLSGMRSGLLDALVPLRALAAASHPSS
jgi:hypothetical protein